MCKQRRKVTRLILAFYLDSCHHESPKPLRLTAIQESWGNWRVIPSYSQCWVCCFKNNREHLASSNTRDWSKKAALGSAIKWAKYKPSCDVHYFHTIACHWVDNVEISIYWLSIDCCWNLVSISISCQVPAINKRDRYLGPNISCSSWTWVKFSDVCTASWAGRWKKVRIFGSNKINAYCNLLTVITKS